MPKRNFREFKVGDKLRILEDRREHWQPEHELTVTHVENHGYTESKGHPQTLTMSNGGVYSGWWFDPASKCLWARVPEISSSHP
jgi:hypothetical protein